MASQSRADLIVNDVAAATGYPSQWNGGRAAVFVEAGVWGGGNVVLQAKSPNGTWMNIDATLGVFTGNGVALLELPPGQLRAVITAATGVYVSVVGTLIS